MYVGISIVKKKRKKAYQGLETSRVSSPIVFPCLSSHLSIPVRVFVPQVLVLMVVVLVLAVLVVVVVVVVVVGFVGFACLPSGSFGLRLVCVGSLVFVRVGRGLGCSRTSVGLGFGSHLAKQWQGGACTSMGEGRIDDVVVCNHVQTCL